MVLLRHRVLPVGLHHGIHRGGSGDRDEPVCGLPLSGGYPGPRAAGEVRPLGAVLSDASCTGGRPNIKHLYQHGAYVQQHEL